MFYLTVVESSVHYKFFFYYSDSNALNFAVLLLGFEVELMRAQLDLSHVWYFILELIALKITTLSSCNLVFNLQLYKR